MKTPCNKQWRELGWKIEGNFTITLRKRNSNVTKLHYIEKIEKKILQSKPKLFLKLNLHEMKLILGLNQLIQIDLKLSKNAQFGLKGGKRRTLNHIYHNFHFYSRKLEFCVENLKFFGFLMPPTFICR